MTTAATHEFSTVEILLQSDAETRAVDAFAISWVKLEKQLRRLTSNLIFQHSVFEEGVSEHKSAVRNAILQKRTANHDRFIGAVYRLSNHSVKELIGDRYRCLKRDTNAAYQYRNKMSRVGIWFSPSVTKAWAKRALVSSGQSGGVEVWPPSPCAVISRVT